VFFGITEKIPLRKEYGQLMEVDGRSEMV